MAGGKGKSTGGKAGPKETTGKTQKSHSAKAGLQVSFPSFIPTKSGSLSFVRMKDISAFTKGSYSKIYESLRKAIENYVA